MNGENTNALVGQLAADDIIKSRIFTIRGVQVMLDTGALSSDKIRQESVSLIAAANRGLCRCGEGPWYAIHYTNRRK